MAFRTDRIYPAFLRLTRRLSNRQMMMLLAAERCHTVRAERLLSERERAAAEDLRRAAEEGGTRAALARFKKIIDDPSIKS